MAIIEMVDRNGEGKSSLVEILTLSTVRGLRRPEHLHRNSQSRSTVRPRSGGSTPLAFHDRIEDLRVMCNLSDSDDLGECRNSTSCPLSPPSFGETFVPRFLLALRY